MPSSFSSWNSFFDFARAVRLRSRFLHDEQVIAFLQAVSDSTGCRCKVFPAGTVLWRAQLGHDWRKRYHDEETWDEPAPYNADRMKPRRDSAHEGRVNPRGIPCLYAASKKETAIAEQRPGLGALVSVAQMQAARELRLVNCSEGHDTDFNINFNIYFEELPPQEREEAVWREIGRAFSSPASMDPGVAEYVPTQILAEHFRNLQFDGVIYKSMLGTGFNIALFDLDALEIVDLRLYPVKAVNYEIGEIQDSYVVKHKKSTHR